MFIRTDQVHFFNKNVRISLKIWLKFVAKFRIDNIPALFQKTSEPMMI